MNSTHYFAIAVRIFAIALFLYSIRQSHWLFEVLMTGSLAGISVTLPPLILTTILPMAVAGILWTFPILTSRFIIKPEIDLQVVPMSINSALTVGILILGLFAFYHAITDAFYWTVFLSVNEESLGSGLPLLPSIENRASMWATGAEVLVSFVIILKARTISRYLLEITS